MHSSFRHTSFGYTANDSTNMSKTMYNNTQERRKNKSLEYISISVGIFHRSDNKNILDTYLKNVLRR